MQAEGTPAFLMTDNGCIRNVEFRDSVVTAANGVATLIGTKTHAIEDVRLENLHMTVTPIKKMYELEIPDPIPGYWQQHFAPCNLYMRYVQNIKVRNLSIDWLHNPDFDHSFCAVALRNGVDVRIENLTATAYDKTGYLPAVLVEHSESVTIL